jgi:hypothetical protein
MVDKIWPPLLCPDLGARHVGTRVDRWEKWMRAVVESGEPIAHCSCSLEAMTVVIGLGAA